MLFPITTILGTLKIEYASNACNKSRRGEQWWINASHPKRSRKVLNINQGAFSAVFEGVIVEGSGYC